MKLSEKGYLKIGNSIVGWFENGVAKVTFDPDKIEFKPDDFKDCVVLTVEEAKVIAIFFGAVDACCDLRISKTEQKVWRKIKKLIGQAEKEQ